MFDWFFGKKSPPAPPKVGPDFSTVDSRAKAEAMAQRGELSKLLLLPAGFGGSDDPRNVVYVPPFVIDLKASIDNNIIAPLVSEAKITNYAAVPNYQGKSFVPISIEIIASDPGDFKTLLAIWGDALEGNT